MEGQLEVQRQFRQQQEKYIYYTIGLSVTSIGFSVYNTTGKALSFSQIPLGISVLCWLLSIYLGLRFISYVLSTLYANNAYFEILKGEHPDVGNNPRLITTAVSAIKGVMEVNANKANALSKWHIRLLYAGIISFIVWRIIEMSIAS